MRDRNVGGNAEIRSLYQRDLGDEARQYELVKDIQVATVQEGSFGGSTLPLVHGIGNWELSDELGNLFKTPAGNKSLIKVKKETFGFEGQSNKETTKKVLQIFSYILLKGANEKDWTCYFPLPKEVAAAMGEKPGLYRGTVELPNAADQWIILITTGKNLQVEGKIERSTGDCYHWSSPIRPFYKEEEIELKASFSKRIKREFAGELVLTAILDRCGVFALWKDQKTGEAVGWTIEKNANISKYQNLKKIQIIQKDRPRRYARLLELEANYREYIRQGIWL